MCHGITVIMMMIMILSLFFVLYTPAEFRLCLFFSSKLFSPLPRRVCINDDDLSFRLALWGVWFTKLSREKDGERRRALGLILRFGIERSTLFI